MWKEDVHEEKHDIYITCGFEWDFQGEWHVCHIKLETGIAWSELDSDKFWGTFQESEMIRRKWLIWWEIETAALSYLRACWKLQIYKEKRH